MNLYSSKEFEYPAFILTASKSIYKGKNKDGARPTIFLTVGTLECLETMFDYIYLNIFNIADTVLHHSNAQTVRKRARPASSLFLPDIWTCT